MLPEKDQNIKTNSFYDNQKFLNRLNQIYAQKGRNELLEREKINLKNIQDTIENSGKYLTKKIKISTQSTTWQDIQKRLQE